MATRRTKKAQAVQVHGNVRLDIRGGKGNSGTLTVYSTTVNDTFEWLKGLLERTKVNVQMETFLAEKPKGLPVTVFMPLHREIKSKTLTAYWVTAQELKEIMLNDLHNNV